MQWGYDTTDSDGVARIYFPISFTYDNYKVIAMHVGDDGAICWENLGYRSVSFVPIIVSNMRSYSQGQGWPIWHICIGT